MRPSEVFCPNADCAARGQVGEGNIRSHGQARMRYKCTVCGQTFSARAGTPYFRRRTEEETIAQVVKQYAGRAVTGALHRLAHGSVRQFLTLLWSTPGCQVLNTAFIERLNGTFRSRLASFGRRTRCAARRTETVERALYLVGTLYNFCAFHTSLGAPGGLARTPAMAAGITDHRWSVAELLHHRIPPPPWQPPKRRGRRSRELQALIDRWCHATV